MKPFERRLTLAFAGALLLLAAAIFLSLSVSREQARSEQQVAHSLEVLNAVERVMTEVINAETGERGYLITGSDDYLAPYNSASARMDSALARLTRLTENQPMQRGRVDLLREQTSRKFRELELTLAARRDTGFASARALVLTHVGKTVMDDIRQTVALMEAAENARLEDGARRAAAIGRRTTMEFTLTGVLVGGALILFYSLTMRGLGERRRDADAIQGQREWLRVTLSSIGDAVIATDQTGAVVFMNPVAESLTGWMQTEAQGRQVGEVFRIVREDTRQPVDNPALRAIRDGAVVGLANQTVLLARNGAEIPIDDSGAPIRDAQGATLGAVLVFRAVVERRKAEQERSELLRREQDARVQAESASTMKDDFLAVASHELRTPVMSLRLQVRIVARALEEALRTAPLSDRGIIERINALNQVVDSDSRRLGDLIEGLLDVTRIASGQFDLHPADADLVEIVRSVLTGLPREADSAAPITLEAPPQLPGRWDRRRIEQVVTNLASNAVRYAGDQPIVVRLRAEHDQVAIEVEDRGPGIPAHVLPDIFERFGRGGASDVRGGLGLGLYIARRIVIGHGGRLEARSVEGRGTTFTAHLPRVTTG